MAKGTPRHVLFVLPLLKRLAAFSRQDSSVRQERVRQRWLATGKESVKVLDFLQLGSSLSLRSFCRMGSDLRCQSVYFIGPFITEGERFPDFEFVRSFIPGCRLRAVTELKL